MPHDKARKLMERLRVEAEQGGYFLNPDEGMVLDLAKGLIVNRERYGYAACPCMEAEGQREEDLDIICPCDYRDADLEEFGTCFCALYVSEEVVNGEREARSIPLRRPPAEERSHIREARAAAQKASGGAFDREAAMPVWRCTVCGYLCARNDPPLKCPVCKVDKDRFERFA